jgi:uncharacterized membrane protein YczE
MTAVGRAHPLARRLLQLYLGLALFGASCGLLVQSGLGVTPWDVLHQGIARQTGGSLGLVILLSSVVVLLIWIPLRQRVGLGTISNPFVVAGTIEATIQLVPIDPAWPIAATYAAAGIVLNGVATAAYIGARFGPGPRDGLMTGFVARTGLSIRLVRSTIEVIVVLSGWALGGTLGAATVAYALLIGPLAQRFLPSFDTRPTQVAT